MEPTRNNVGIHRILRRVAQFVVETLHEEVALFYQGMSGFVVQSAERRCRLADDTVMRHCVELLIVRRVLISEGVVRSVMKQGIHRDSRVFVVVSSEKVGRVSSPRRLLVEVAKVAELGRDSIQ